MALETIRKTGVDTVFRQSRLEFGAGVATIGPDSLAWLRRPVNLPTSVIYTQPVCEVASAVDTNRKFASLYWNGMSAEERMMADAVMQFEIGNILRYQSRPDQILFHEDKDIPPVFRINHRILGQDGISIFVVRQRGMPDNPRFILGAASRIDEAEEVLAEMAENHYVNVVNIPAPAEDETVAA